MDFAGKVALITGAGSGIGKAAATLFGQHGMKVAVLSHTRDEVQQTADEIQRQGGEALALTADVANEQQIQRAIQEVVNRWGRLDVVFANAGINGVWAPIEELTLDQWQQTLTTNLTGTFLTIKEAVPYLKKQGGSIVVTASVNGTRVFSNTGATAYSTTKAGQVAMAKMLAVELAPHNVRVNIICPGKTETEIEENTEHRNVEKIKFPVEYPKGPIPLGKGDPAKAEQVAQLALFLASDAASHITGTEVWIDGAASLIQG
jgi:NAD(P)-dependent dehydrogenase (short-subunit alcohol dehydrogenase family)